MKKKWEEKLLEILFGSFLSMQTPNPPSRDLKEPYHLDVRWHQI